MGINWEDIVEALDLMKDEINFLRRERSRLLEVQSQAEIKMVCLNNRIDALYQKVVELERELAHEKA